MKFSIIIATLNNEKTINKNLNSIKNQLFNDYEIIVIDGGSTDRTINIIESYNFKDIKIKKQNGVGVYNAFNEGINHSKYEIIIILNADDYFENRDVLKIISKHFSEEKNIDLLMSNIKILNSKNQVLRIYKNNIFQNFMFYFGLMPPHPGIFVKRKIYLEHGFFREDFQNAGDFEFLLRILLKKNVKYKKIDDHLISMLQGGKSNKNLKSYFINTIEIKKALNLNNLFSSYILISLRFLIKLFQFRKIF